MSITIGALQDLTLQQPIAQFIRRRGPWLRSLCACAVFAPLQTLANAGEVLIVNASSAPITCRGDGSDQDTHIAAGSSGKVAVGVNAHADPLTKIPTLNSVDCGQGLRVRAMNLTKDGASNRFLLVNGHQRRVLNVLLYSAIPTDPDAGYMPLVRWMTETYQASHPNVLLNVILDPAIDIYDFKTLKSSVLGKDGVDIAELDTVFLKYLHDSDLILPVTINPAEAWSVANKAVALDGATFGIPSWLCSDFLYSAKPEDRVTTFGQLRTFLHAGHTLTADLDGSWTIPSLYIQAAVQMGSFGSASEALAGTIDSEVVKRLAEVGAWCEGKEKNPCIDKTFHKANQDKDGALEQHFDTDPTLADIGFSERSFYLDYYATEHQALHLVPFPWGDQASAAHLVYVDAFVVNAHTCEQNPCKDDAARFAQFATSVGVKKHITLSKDLKAGSPPRHLLAASRAFYEDSEIRNDAVYSQVRERLLSGPLLPYATDFTPEGQYNLLNALCPKLISDSPKWACKVPPKPESVVPAQ